MDDTVVEKQQCVQVTSQKILISFALTYEAVCSNVHNSGLGIVFSRKCPL